MNTSNPSSSDKKYLRGYYLDQRKRLSEAPDAKRALDNEIQARLLMSPEYRKAEKILIYCAREREIATRMIIYAAFANHKEVGLPVSLDEGRMIFRRITDMNDLTEGRFGIPEPDESCPELVADSTTLCVCPSLCCDMSGFRLGFGGGYYDRYLEDFSGAKVALCYSDSIIPEIETDDHDVAMDAVFTDSFTKRF